MSVERGSTVYSCTLQCNLLEYNGLFIWARLPIIISPWVYERNEKTKKTWRTHKNYSFRVTIASATLKDVSLQLNGMLMMWKISVAGNARRCHPDRQNSSRFLIPVCQFSSPLTEILVEKTEPARCLIWTYRKFYNGCRGKARSRKPGSCKEALKVQMVVFFFCFRDVKHIVVFTVTKP